MVEHTDSNNMGCLVFWDDSESKYKLQCSAKHGLELLSDNDADWGTFAKGDLRVYYIS